MVTHGVLATTLPKGGMEKAPKRLRGWHLAKEKATPSSEKRPCQKGVGGSALVTRLLELWSQGKISASQAVEIANLAKLEGAASEEILPGVETFHKAKAIAIEI